VTTREPNGPRRPGSEQPARARRDTEGPQPAFEHRERLQLRLRRPTTAAPRRSGAAAKAPLAFVFTCLPGESAHVKQETNGLCVHSLHPAPLTCRRGPLPVELPPETVPSPNYVHNLTNRQLELTPVLSRAHCLPPHRQGKHSKRSPEASGSIEPSLSRPSSLGFGSTHERILADQARPASWRDTTVARQNRPRSGLGSSPSPPPCRESTPYFYRHITAAGPAVSARRLILPERGVDLRTLRVLVTCGLQFKPGGSIELNLWLCNSSPALPVDALGDLASEHLTCLGSG
jgi:hypothetical protein